MRVLSLSMSYFYKPSLEVVVLMYHRVSGDINLELDIPLSSFQTQMEWLVKNYHIISLDDLFNAELSYLNGDKPRAVITFDDAFSDFYYYAWPILKKLEIPSTLYVPTEFVEHPDRPPISVYNSGIDSSKLEPMSWDQLREVSSDPNVIIGAHSHAHQEYSSFNEVEIMQDIHKSHELYERELGFIPRHFAYPRGAYSNEANAVLCKHYSSIAFVGGGRLDKQKLKSRYVTRTPILRSDGEFWFKYRVNGSLYYEELLADFIKKR